MQAYAAELEQRVRRHLRSCTGSWRVDGTHIKVKGVWTRLCRAVDSLGQAIDVLLSAQRDAATAKRFFRKADPAATVNPRMIIVDKNPAYPAASREPLRGSPLDPAGLRERAAAAQEPEQQRGAGSPPQRNRRFAQDQTAGPAGLGFGGLRTARHTLAGYETTAMIRKGQVHDVGSRDMQAQAAFIAGLFEVAA